MFGFFSGSLSVEISLPGKEGICRVRLAMGTGDLSYKNYPCGLKSAGVIRSMLKYGINNIGLMFENNLQFLKQFHE